MKTKLDGPHPDSASDSIDTSAKCREMMSRKQVPFAGLRTKRPDRFHPCISIGEHAMKKTLIALFAVVLTHPASTAMALQKAGDAKAATASEAKAAMPATHSARGIVKKLDVAAGVVVLAHGPVQSLNWPSMTMGFKVDDKMLLAKLALGKTVDFEFVQADRGYVITGVK